jgi:hypothetical protein
LLRRVEFGQFGEGIFGGYLLLEKKGLKKGDYY